MLNLHKKTRDGLDDATVLVTVQALAAAVVLKDAGRLRRMR